MQVGIRIISDQDGEIISILGEMQGDVLPRKEITSVHHVDLLYGEVDLMTHNIIGVDLDALKPILEEIPSVETEEQKRIRELEDELLLQAENEVGGIL